MNLLKGSWILKVAALALAVITYFYIHNELESNEHKAQDPSYKLIKLTAKDLPVKVRLATVPPDGYRILTDQVVSDPTHVIVVGPEALLDEASSAETALIDVSDSTKPVQKKIPLESVAGVHLIGDPYTVEVTVPIEKIEVKEVKEAAPEAKTP